MAGLPAACARPIRRVQPAWIDVGRGHIDVTASGEIRGAHGFQQSGTRPAPRAPRHRGVRPEPLRPPATITLPRRRQTLVARLDGELARRRRTRLVSPRSVAAHVDGSPLGPLESRRQPGHARSRQSIAKLPSAPSLLRECPAVPSACLGRPASVRFCADPKRWANVPLIVAVGRKAGPAAAIAAPPNHCTAGIQRKRRRKIHHVHTISTPA